jgi:uncharacterized protein (DUF934 family)
MSLASADARPRLWTQDGFRDDPWRHAEDAGALAEAEAGVILPLAAWLGLDPAQREVAASRLGVLLAPGEPIDGLVPHLQELPLVALVFPAFSDGRSFSKAELLRRRHGYRGTLRAVGDVLIDQIPHMIRTGFTEFEVKNATALARLEAGWLGGLPLHYQPAAKGAAPGSGFSWRRSPAG